MRGEHQDLRCLWTVTVLHILLPPSELSRTSSSQGHFDMMWKKLTVLGFYIPRLTRTLPHHHFLQQMTKLFNSFTQNILLSLPQWKAGFVSQATYCKEQRKHKILDSKTAKQQKKKKGKGKKFITTGEQNPADQHIWLQNPLKPDFNQQYKVSFL